MTNKEFWHKIACGIDCNHCPVGDCNPPTFNNIICAELLMKEYDNMDKE
jgi:hypothetical protein